MSKWLQLIFITSLFLLGLSACQSGSGGITAVTPIPADISSGVVAQITPVPVSINPTRDPNLTPIPTSTINPTRQALEQTRAALPTPTPFIIQMAAGESLAASLAADQAFQPTPRP
jgi:hypothetical protein